MKNHLRTSEKTKIKIINIRYVSASNNENRLYSDLF